MAGRALVARSPADRLGTWPGAGRDVHAYFNNDDQGHAVRDATWLRQRLHDRARA